jgi:cysteine desulfurase
VSGPVYLDFNATSKVRPEAVEAVGRSLALGANPSSIHAAGRAARSAIEAARTSVAGLVGAEPQSVTFVSGGTEANALAIESAVAAGFSRVVVGATEHESVLATAFGTSAAVEVWPVSEHGLPDLAWLENALAGQGRAVVCLMLANNETGVIQPLDEVATIVREAGGWLHVDAVQAAGKIAVDVIELGADTLALSAHKIGGPQGVGALIAGPRSTLTRQLHGGSQERGRRAGTENVPGIVGFGAAAEAAMRDLPAAAAQAGWRTALADRMAHAGAVVLGEAAPRLPQTLCVATPGFTSELQVMALDLAGVMISAGAACSSGKVTASKVITAMGRADLAACSVRISGGWASTQQDWERCGDAWLQALERRSVRSRELA